ncbi:MAG: hypothetical protein ACR2N5_03245 [Solirubrobacterales bacterium]
MGQSERETNRPDSEGSASRDWMVRGVIFGGAVIFLILYVFVF